MVEAVRKEGSFCFRLSRSDASGLFEIVLYSRSSGSMGVATGVGIQQKSCIERVHGSSNHNDGCSL